MENARLESAAIERALYRQYPGLEAISTDIHESYELLCSCFGKGGKLLIAGNGGSAADCDHITGELLKSFRFKRAADSRVQERLTFLFGGEGRALSLMLENGLPTISLPSFCAMLSAYGNDVSFEAAFAEMLIALGDKDDVFLGITSSGNSKNIVNAFMAAKAIGMHSILLTGDSGGKCSALCDIAIRVPASETYLVQEYHLPIYHALCAMVESRFFTAIK